ncbi:hypothetical protein E2542_SST09184 [Spatholobus suberectus]|nr:hypothetical protein E2542_SST09184 [Spatholobus suberectus]
MKREGRQHGMVRSYRILPSPLNPRHNTRYITRFDSPLTAGLFVKVSSKPTNHSKFTGKCGTPRCTDFLGLSATVTLDHLSDDYTEDESGDRSDYHVNYSGTLDDCDWDKKDDNKCISEMGVSFQMDQVEEDKVEDEDWLLVES